jgi:hypothetical protein
VAGDDLVFCLYGNSGASASISASVDGVAFVDIGIISGGTAIGYFKQEYLDLASLFNDDVHYVKATRVANGANTGMFFDAVGAAAPEPGAIVLMVTAAISLFVFSRRRLCLRGG